MQVTQNAIKIEHLELSETDILLSFLQTAYSDNPRQSNLDFWKWHFLETPHTNTNKMPIWVAKSGEKIAGQLAAIPVVLNVGSKKIEAIWILDFIVSPEFRRQGLGKRLVLAAEKFSPVVLSAPTNEQHTPVLLQNLGWVLVGKISRYYKLLFPGNAAHEISRWKPVREAVNLCFAPLRPHFGQNPLAANKKLRFVEKFDSSFDMLWEESEAQWSCAVRRDAKMLEWQYNRQPGKKFDVIGYYENDKLLGYVVLFFRKKDSSEVIAKASITDICYHPSKSLEIVDELLQAALQLAVKRRAGGLVTDVMDNLIEQRLHSFGFWRVKNPLQLMAKSAEHQDLLYNPDKWFLTRGDSDTSIFENPNL